MTRPTHPHVERSGLSVLRTVGPAERTTDVVHVVHPLLSSTPREGVTIPEARPTSDEHGRLTTTKVNPSSWIDKVLYRNHYIAIFLKRSYTRSDRLRTALLYSNVPSWMCGLIQAGEGGRSVGSAYNSLLKRADVQAKYGIQYQRVEGEERVRELERMMTGAL